MVFNFLYTNRLTTIGQLLAALRMEQGDLRNVYKDYFASEQNFSPSNLLLLLFYLFLPNI